MKIYSKLSVRFLILSITLLSFWFIYFDFSTDISDMSTKVVSVIISLFLLWKCIQIFSLYIKIENDCLEIKSMKPNENGVANKTTIPRKYVFLLSDIISIKVEYKQKYHANKFGFIRDIYIGKGRPILVVKTQENVTDIYLDSFNTKKVEKFLDLNFNNKIRV